MAILTFDAAELRPIIEYTLAHDRHSPTFGQMLEKQYLKEGAKLPKEGFPSSDLIDTAKVPPALHLVKDSGIYLMSSAEQRDIVEGKRSRVCYARGFNPARDSDWYDEAHAAVGGDDFVEALPIEWFARLLETSTISAVEVLISDETLEVKYVRRPRTN